jgi:hypothetical protein
MGFALVVIFGPMLFAAHQDLRKASIRIDNCTVMDHRVYINYYDGLLYDMSKNYPETTASPQYLPIIMVICPIFNSTSKVTKTLEFDATWPLEDVTAWFAQLPTPNDTSTQISVWADTRDPQHRIYYSSEMTPRETWGISLMIAGGFLVILSCVTSCGAAIYEAWQKGGPPLGPRTEDVDPSSPPSPSTVEKENNSSSSTV